MFFYLFLFYYIQQIYINDAFIKTFIGEEKIYRKKYHNLTCHVNKIKKQYIQVQKSIYTRRN
jgi:hypothetical protein